MREKDSPQRGPLGVGIIAIYASFVVEIFAFDEVLERFACYSLIHSVYSERKGTELREDSRRCPAHVVMITVRLGGAMTDHRGKAEPHNA